MGALPHTEECWFPVDADTHEPVVGATVSASYPAKSSLFRLFHAPSRTVTDTQGEALLKAYCDHTVDPFFEVVILNEQYDQEVGLYESSNWLNEWMNRPKGFIPTEPDIVLNVTSRMAQKRAEEELDAKHKSDDLAAEELFRNSPDYWPKHRDDPSFPENDADQRLISKRWERASKSSLGTDKDLAFIRAAVLRHMKPPEAKVDEIRWISSSVVMVSSSWYASPLGGASYTYVLRKDDNRWQVLAYYLNSIS